MSFYRNKSIKSVTYVAGKALDVIGTNNPNYIVGFRSDGENFGNMKPITKGELVKKQIKQVKDYENSRKE
jgi:hypothetical protein